MLSSTHLRVRRAPVSLQEFDEDVDNGFRPAGLMRLSSTTIDGVVYLQDDGSVFDSGTATHSLVLHRRRAVDGAWVFGAGTCQWVFGLDGHHDSPASVPPHLANPYSTRVSVDLAAPDRTIEQATINVFALMGVQPATLLSHLVPAEACTDATPPTASMERIMATIAEDGSKVLVFEGAATDIGGAVAAVEISMDAGQSWHPAEPSSQAFATWEGRLDDAQHVAVGMTTHGTPSHQWHVVVALDECPRDGLYRVRSYDDCGNVQLRCYELA